MPAQVVGRRGTVGHRAQHAEKSTGPRRALKKHLRRQTWRRRDEHILSVVGEERLRSLLQDQYCLMAPALEGASQGAEHLNMARKGRTDECQAQRDFPLCFDLS